jgi:hypothetical protein
VEFATTWHRNHIPRQLKTKTCAVRMGETIGCPLCAAEEDAPNIETLDPRGDFTLDDDITRSLGLGPCASLSQNMTCTVASWALDITA